MVVVMIMDLLKSFLLFVIGLFPALPDMTWFSNTVDAFFEILSYFNLIVDFRVVCLCVVTLFIFSNIEFVWGVIMWVIRKIPGVS